MGNSLAVRIPKAFAVEVDLSPDADVEVTVLEGKVVVTPVRAPYYTLKGVLTKVTPRNRHTEVEWGPSAGREVW